MTLSVIYPKSLSLNWYARGIIYSPNGKEALPVRELAVLWT
jgi:hypothetical protein